MLIIVWFRLVNAESLCLLLGYVEFDLFSRARVAQGPIRLQDGLFAAVTALAWRGQWLILFVFHFPLDLIVASLAEEVQWSLCDALGELAVIVEFELVLVLVLLSTLLPVRH